MFSPQIPMEVHVMKNSSNTDDHTNQMAEPSADNNCFICLSSGLDLSTTGAQLPAPDPGVATPAPFVTFCT